MPQWVSYLAAFLSAACAAIVAHPDFVDLPSSLRVLVAALIAGFAAVGIRRPQDPNGEGGYAGVELVVGVLLVLILVVVLLRLVD